MVRPVVLITGCSSGIGRALCEAFHCQNYRVVATARRPEALADLAAQGMLTLPLDVTDSAAIERAIDEVLTQEGRLDILVNNAGYGQFGPLIDVSPETMQQQFATNVFAPMELIQRVAPAMKAQGAGTIINIGSISGLVTTPFAGAYCASKAAFHAVSDALRLELKPFGINVVTVQPGAITSNFGRAGEASLSGWEGVNSWYGPLREQIRARASLSQSDGMAAQEFADHIVKRVTQGTPPARIRLGPKSQWLPLLQLALPTRWFEALLTRKFGLNPLPAHGSHNR
jgi:NAD(P)-dependent dehydrogenase (short-subunit alcohol dehydrogenase family)